ncbi:hypothetical protein ACFQ6U_06785 [Streptomyces sp. NPDC056465]|uniref:hypothetical protein n=1 Tax=Streptomyces sp. NPDC056465 TaxID=3345829 RepID=UPI0036C99A54
MDTSPRLPDPLRAIVFDANALGNGLPHLGKVRRIAALASDAGAGSWIPELVALEWAEHLVREVDAFRVAAKSAVKIMSAAGIDAQLPVLPSDGQAVAEGFLRELEAVPGVTIVELSGDAARAGLKDQIMQTGPGRKKQGVKTGGSDSAWLRDVLAKAGGSFDDVVLLSQDGDVQAACKALRVAPPRMMNWKDFNQALFRLVKSPQVLERRITAYFSSLVDDSKQTHHDGAEPEMDLGDFEADEALLLAGSYQHQPELNDVSLSRVYEVLDVSDIRMEYAATSEKAGDDPRNATLEATVAFRADLDVSTYELTVDGGVEMGSHPVDDVRVTSSLIIEVSDGEIRSYEPVDRFRVTRM